MARLPSPLQTLFITLIIITISCKKERKFHPQCEETPKYYKAFKLPAKDQFDEKRSFAKGKRRIKNIGQLNCTLYPKYMHSSQPVLFITNRKDSIITQINYNPNKENLINKLKAAIEN